MRDAKNPNQKKDQGGLGRVQAQLSKAQLAAAEKALREWHPETADAAPPRNTIKLAQATGAIPENINFAIKGEEAQAFLKSHGVVVKTAAAEPQQLAPAAIADRALNITLRIECWK